MGIRGAAPNRRDRAHFIPRRPDRSSDDKLDFRFSGRYRGNAISAAVVDLRTAGADTWIPSVVRLVADSRAKTDGMASSNPNGLSVGVFGVRAP